MPGESYHRQLRSLLLCVCVASFKCSLTSLCVDSGKSSHNHIFNLSGTEGQDLERKGKRNLFSVSHGNL